MMTKKLLALSMAACAGMAAHNAAADNISLLDYQEATSAYENAYVSGRLNVNSGNQGQTSHDLNVDANYDRVFQSPNRDVTLKGNIQGSSKRGSNKGDATVENYLGNAAVGMNNYFQPNSNGAFWFTDADLGVKKGADDPRLAVGAGVGYGRVKNVTPMAQAIRLVEALREKNLITGELTKADYNQLANIVARESEYRSKFGAVDYRQNWIADMEKALVASGKVSNSIGAVGILKSYDVLVNERISTRKYGWLVKAGLGAVLQDYNGDSGKPALNLAGEYHLPLSNRTQFSNEATASTVLDSDGSYVLTNNLSLNHEVSDRVDWLNSWKLNYNRDKSTDKDVTSNALNSTYRYYLSNKMAFDTVASLSKVEDDVANNGNDDIDKSLFMGVTYRLK